MPYSSYMVRSMPPAENQPIPVPNDCPFLNSNVRMNLLASL